MLLAPLISTIDLRSYMATFMNNHMIIFCLFNHSAQLHQLHLNLMVGAEQWMLANVYTTSKEN